jgi:hypothetical protein
LPIKTECVDSKCINRRNEKKKFNEDKLKKSSKLCENYGKMEKNECDEQK